MDFHARKLAALQAMASPFPDKSRKGDVDAQIAPLIARINAHPAYFTTSSCSGRISISTSPSSSFAEAVDAFEYTDVKGEEDSIKKKKKTTKKKMKGGDWSFITHDPADADGVVRTVVGSFAEENQGKKELLGNTVFRFEPFILAVECLDLAAAQAIVACAIYSGFRESGITSVRRRIIAAVRCSIRIEAPIAEKGCLLVDEEYLKFLVRAANEKMLANHRKTEKFFTEFITQIEVPYTQKNTSTFFSSRDLSHKCRSKARESGKHNSRKLAELEKRQLSVLSQIFDMEARVQQGVLQVSGLASDISNKSKVEQEISAVVKETQESDGTCSPAKVVIEMFAAEDVDLSTSSQDSGLELEGSLAGAMFSKLNDSSEKLYRWGHSTCLLPGPFGTSSHLLVTFGGYGGYGKQCRQNDLVILDCLNGKLHSISAKNPPVARIGHTASLIGPKMVVIGGREDPSKPLADVCILQLDKMEWIYPEIGGAWFPPRHRHAAASIREKIYVFGGLCNLDVLGDLYVLDLSELRWSRLECSGDVPTPRHSHSLSVIDEKLYLFGGFDGQTICGDLFVLEINSFIWSKINCDRIYRFSHSMTVVDRSLLFLGGCPLTKHVNVVSLLNVDSMQWSHRRVILPTGSILIRHTATCLGKQIAIVGGGVSCYAFGIKFSPSILMDLTFLPNHAFSLEKQPDCLTSGTSSSECVWGLKVDKHLAKLTKDILKQLGWLDMRKKVAANEDGHITFPLRKAAVSCINGSSKRGTCVEGCATSEKLLKEVLFLTEISQNSEIVQMQSYIDTKPKKTPWERLLSSMRSLIKMHNLPESLLLDLPKRWERLDDMVVLPETAFRSEAWQSIGEQLWITIAKCLNVQRVARQARVKANDIRESNLELLLGEDGWVCHRENGLLYCFDTTKCMFSSGNISEKLRMTGMECIGETVVDLFAGIGYFVLPLLKANAKKVFACEWNPFALNALRYNLHVNDVEDRCIVLEGDNKLTAPKGVADRVCLGLLPSSEDSWEVAVQALRPEGGVLHIHGNVKDTEEKAWVCHVHSSISNLSKSQGHSWDIRITHVEKVKWYAPHIRHLVADVECKAK